MQEQLGTQMGIEAFAAPLGLAPGTFIAIFLLVSIWSLAIKGYALWYAAREDQRSWFIALLVVNTFGLLELAYLLFFRPKDEEEEI